MKKTKLGNSTIEVAPLTLGGNVFGWTIGEEKSFEILDEFAGAGFNLIDTADVYSLWVPGNKGGESETIIGKWMHEKNNRSNVVVATKVGADMGQGKKDLTKKYILGEVENSLRRLQTDYIDLYQTHWDDIQTPVEETLEAYSQLVKEGKVRIIGASNLTSARLKASLQASKKYAYPRYETFQPEYNLYDREGFEKELERVCAENNISVISYFSLASGFLTGKYRSEKDLSKSQRGAGIKKFLNERGFKILEALDQVSKEYSTTPASIAISWLLTRPTVVAPISSATTTEQLQDLLKATELKLSNEAINVLNRASEWKAES
jgi:aryl-alcohol dehydrogenase-like predicted oxidoreductase